MIEEIKARYQAMLIASISKGFITLESGGGEYKISIQFQNSEDLWDTYEPLIKIITIREEGISEQVDQTK